MELAIRETRPNVVQPIALKNQILASLQDRWLLVGATGTGKTTFAIELVKRMREAYPFANLYVLDSKGAGDFKGFPLIPHTIAPAAMHYNGGIQVWQPLRNDRKEINNWLGNIFNARRPCIVLIDDLPVVANQSGQVENYDVLQKVGRGLNMCVVSLVQELVDNPRSAFSQATHLVAFQVINDYDQRVLKNKLQLGKEYKAPPKYGFHHKLLGTLEPTRLYRSWHDFFNS